MGGAKLAFLKIITYPLHKLRYRKYYISDILLGPLNVTPKYITLGRNVYIYYGARIEGVHKYNNINFKPNILIGNGVRIQQNLHLTCARYVSIGDNTAIAANVTITDIHHPYENLIIPIERQDISVKEVVIGEDCKIYNNAVILPGTHIGKHVTIGANSVVFGEIPDYCVVCGAPARIVKKYNCHSQKWERV
jgi:acetyltransferase-like isoleucine patch superfamily enzyme